MMEPLLRLEHVSKSFILKGQQKIQALNDVNLSVHRGETLGIVGESGCGKSTLARVIMGVYPTAEGKVFFEGQHLDVRKRKQRLAFAEKVQMVFQDPYMSLNPRMTVEDIVGENLIIHKKLSPKERKQRVRELLEAVGLRADYAGRFPNEFSGGQRQRICIARTLALNPSLLICDEPISALDVSVQSQIMNLLKKLRNDMGLTYLFIAHDLNMVHYISDRVAVMYKGHIVELAPSAELYERPLHPYTRLLLEAVLIPKPGHITEFEKSLTEPVSLARSANSCPFAEKCPNSMPQCIAEKPVLREKSAGHWVACHLETHHA